jgi:Tol biopolymer transport system component
MDGGWRVVVDAQAGKPYENDIRDPIFSPDGKRVAYAGKADGRWRMVVDGQEGTPYNDDIRNPRFSPDSKRVAYAGMADRKWRVVVDDREGPEYTRTSASRRRLVPIASIWHMPRRKTRSGGWSWAGRRARFSTICGRRFSAWTADTWPMPPGRAGNGAWSSIGIEQTGATKD